MAIGCVGSLSLSLITSINDRDKTENDGWEEGKLGEWCISSNSIQMNTTILKQISNPRIQSENQLIQST